MNRDDIKALMTMAVLMVMIFVVGVLLNLWVVFWGMEMAAA